MNSIRLRDVVLVLFFLSSVSFGLMSFFFPVEEAVSGTAALVMGLAFGLFFSGTMGGLLYLWKRRAGYEEIPAVRQSADLIVNRDVPAVTQVVIEALGRLKTRSVVISETIPVGITASTRITWKSFGERIEVAVSPLNGGRSSVHFATRPIIPFTLVDYGKGLDNVRQLTESIRGL